METARKKATINKALDNAAIHSLQYGQLGARSGTLTAAHNKTSLNNVTLRVSSQRTTTLKQDVEFVTYPSTLQSKISVSVEGKYQPSIRLEVGPEPNFMFVTVSAKSAKKNLAGLPRSIAKVEGIRFWFVDLVAK